MVLTAVVYGADVRPIDEIMHGGNQVRTAAKTLDLKVLRDYGGSSDYGRDSFMIQRGYKIADATGQNEVKLLSEIRDEFKKDIARRGWEVSAPENLGRADHEDFNRFPITYQAKQRIGTIVIKSVRAPDGWFIFVDLLEQNKRVEQGEDTDAG